MKKRGMEDLIAVKLQLLHGVSYLILFYKVHESSTILGLSTQKLGFRVSFIQCLEQFRQFQFQLHWQILELN